METKRVLLAWELGLGFGHSTKLARIGAQLQAQGHHLIAAVPSTSLATPLAALSIPVRAAPAWTTAYVEGRRASASLTDSLAQAGLADEAGTGRVLAGWRALLDEVRPDLVVCDYAPLLTLAARGRARVFQVGVGYCLPPSHLDAFPVLHTFAPPLFADADVLARVNRALAGQALPPAARIGDLFGGDDAFVTTFQTIDPYADVRERQAEGPLLQEPPRAKRPDAAGIFAYLHPDVVERPHVSAALCTLGAALELVSPGAPGALLAPLAAAGVRVHERPQRLAQVLARTRLVLHQGSAGIAADALAAGVPQYTMCWHVEHYLTGEALAAAGGGRNCHLFDPAFVLDPGDILDFARDAEAAFMAEVAGRMHRAALEPDPMTQILRRCGALLGQP